MKHRWSLGFALLALSAGMFGESVALAAPAPPKGKPVHVLLFAGGPTREYQFLRSLFVGETEQKRAELSVCLQRPVGTSQSVPGVPVERVLKQFPSSYDPDKKTDKPEEIFTNLDHYDVIIAIDPDWLQLSDEQRQLLNKWVDKGGGLIVIGGPMNTLQLARPGSNREKLMPVLNLLPVVLRDIRLELLDRTTEAPWPLVWYDVAKQMNFLKLTEEGEPGKADWSKDWREFFYGNQEGKGPVQRGFHNYYPTDSVKPGSAIVACFGDPRAKMKDASQMPYLVLSVPEVRRVVWIGWGETWRLRQYRADYYTRFWTHLVRYAAARRPSANKLIALPAKLIEPPPGLTAAEKRAVEKGLDWLVKAQKRDGHWENKDGRPIALTGLAGITLLMDGNTLTEGKHADAVRRAADYLIFRAQPNGLIRDPKVDSERTEYLIGHAFALEFLAQCYGEDEDMDRRKKLEGVLTKAVDFSCQAQCNSGGWGSISAKDGGNRQGDVFATLVQFQALRAVRRSGFAVPADVLDRARAYLEKEVEPSTLSSAAAVAIVFGTGPYDTSLAQKWLKAVPAPAALGEGLSLRDEYLNFGHARLAYSLADTGYGKLFPDSKANERLIWSSYRKSTFAALLKAQSTDGNWDEAANGVDGTALYLAILLLPENTLPVFSTSR